MGNSEVSLLVATWNVSSRICEHPRGLFSIRAESRSDGSNVAVGFIPRIPFPFENTSVAERHLMILGIGAPAFWTARDVSHRFAPADKKDVGFVVASRTVSGRLPSVRQANARPCRARMGGTLFKTRAWCALNAQ